MAAPLPPAGIIPVRHPSLPSLWLAREAGNAAFRQMNRLISALYYVAPRVLDDPDFLERSVLVDGVAPSTSPRDLRESFSILDVEAAVLVRDSSRGYRVGLVVFADAAESASAINLTPRPGFYVACIPAEADRDEASSLLRLLLPPYIITQEEYRRRVILLRGLDTERWQCDAAEIAYLLEHRVDLRHQVEAVVIHRAMGLVVVVFGGPEDVDLLLQEPPETWLRFSGMRWGLSPCCLIVTLLHASRFLTPPRPQQQLSFSTRDWAGPVAYCKIRNWLTYELMSPGPGYDVNREVKARRIVHRLIALCALENPATVWSSSFPDRSLILSGIPMYTDRTDLEARLSTTFGAMHALVHAQLKGIAVAVFKSWHGAARLGRRPAEDWYSLGFTGCGRVPYVAYTHDFIAAVVVDELARLRSRYGPSP